MPCLFETKRNGVNQPTIREKAEGTRTRVCQHLDGKELFQMLLITTLALRFHAELPSVHQES
jgi:hypothetical protein